MKKKILLPTDFSHNSYNAITYALDLYEDEACVFYILNAFSVSSYGFGDIIALQADNGAFKKEKESAKSKLEELMHKIVRDKAKNSNHSFEKVVIYEDPLKAIKNAIEKYDIDLVVMGTKGNTASKEIVYGSLAIQVMEKSRNCPVLVVPENANYASLKDIVFPTSFRTHYKKRELKVLGEIAEKSSANIRVLHVSDEKDSLDENQEEHKKMLDEYFENVIHTYHFMNDINKESAIDYFVEERGADLVAFINKKHLFFGSIFSRPLVKSITYRTKVPILVMHDLRN